MQRCETRLGRQSVGGGSGSKNHWDFIAAETSRTQPTILPDFFRQTIHVNYREAQTSKEIRPARKQEDAFGIAPLGFLQQASQATPALNGKCAHRCLANMRQKLRQYATA